LSGNVYTDTLLNKLSYHTSPDCVSGGNCSGYIKFANWMNEIDVATFHPIGMATVLSYLSSTLVNDTQNITQQNMTGQASQNQTQMDFDTISQAIQKDQDRSKQALIYLHELIMKIHEKIPGFDETKIEEPTKGILADWGHDGIFEYGTVFYPSDVAYRDFVRQMIQPMGAEPVHFINSDFSDSNRDLESSIIQVERVLSTLGVEPPAWNTDSIYKFEVTIE